MAKATLNKNGIATKAGDMTVYNYHGDTREYLASSVEFLAVGVGIPANSCIDAPVEEKDGFIVCRTVSLGEWEYVRDHRGETAYDMETGQPVKITELGDYPPGMTTIEPLTPYDRWNGNAWITDKDAQKDDQIADAEKKRIEFLAKAKNTISLWQTELQLGIIGDADKASLIAWMKYIQALNAVDTSTAPDIEWPVKPE
ncbi:MULTISPECIES: tail fiber assembly protein [unclassified Escherichia]|uniref:tail fiber assembly protein n=1 Tax=unclassified Escherichia TaxID=2608889 RepID=UPI001029F23C|nr:MULTISPECIES: tail fiber assembly protein [unclassified Escherichia]RZM90260.1 tail fiber assembly protein [Escherichia sp. E1V33]TBR65926.1 tail fiber assembly protein [Escherichia sp. E1S7]